MYTYDICTGQERLNLVSEAVRIFGATLSMTEEKEKGKKGYVLRIFDISHILLSVDRTDLYPLLLGNTLLLSHPFPLIVLPDVVCPPS